MDSCKCCGTGHIPRQCYVYRKQGAECGKPNHFKAVCKSRHRWKLDWWVRRAVHEVSQEDRLHQGSEEGRTEVLTMSKNSLTLIA